VLNRPCFALSPASICLAVLLNLGQEAPLPEPLIKARFIARVAGYGQWPAATRVTDKSRPFVIGILGRSAVEPFLSEEARSVGSLKGKPVEVRVLRTLSRIDQCDLLFVCESEQDRLEDILRRLEGKPVLTLSDTPGFMGRGIMFNLLVKEDRLSYEVNMKSMRASGLEVEPRVLARATAVLK
jgi:hypothetical protein